MQSASTQSYISGKIRLSFKINFENLAAGTNQLCVLFTFHLHLLTLWGSSERFWSEVHGKLFVF